MAAAIRGGRQALSEKPYFMHLVTPLPLYYAKPHIDQIVEAAESGVPLSVGAPSQSHLAEMAMCEASRRLGVKRITSTAGWTLSRRFNQDAAAEIAANMTHAFYSRPAVCPYLGTIDEGITFSLPALLFGDELAGLLRRMWRGIEVSDEMLALEMTRQEGPRGNYLAHEHTAKYCRRETWNARYLGAKYPTASGGLPDEDLSERIDHELQEILRNHRPEPLAEAILDEMRAIREAFTDCFRRGPF